LVRLYWPAPLRPAFDALFDLDDAMADAVARSTEPTLAAIKLAWWRERLEELDQSVPAEPRLRAVAAELQPRGVTGGALAELTDGWMSLLEKVPDPERTGEGGARLFAIAAQLLDAADPLIETAGRLYGNVRVSRRDLTSVHLPMDDLHHLTGHQFAKDVRPLTALAALAARDARRLAPEAEGTPGRSWALMRHRLTGRV
jgi:phytoene synthase